MCESLWPPETFLLGESLGSECGNLQGGASFCRWNPSGILGGSSNGVRMVEAESFSWWYLAGFQQGGRLLHATYQV